MKSSSTIRIFDRYLGSFACLVLSSFRFLTETPLKNSKIKNILIIEFFEMGASIMATPSIRYIKRHFPEANIFVLTTEGIKPSWLKIGELNEEFIFSLKEKNLFSFILSFFKHIFLIRKLEIDVIIDFELFFRVTALFSFFIKAHSKSGFFRYNMEGLYRGSIYNKPCHFNQNSHISRNFLALTKTALSTQKDLPNFKNSIDYA